MSSETQSWNPATAPAAPPPAAPEPAPADQVSAVDQVAALVGKVVVTDDGRYGLVVDVGRSPNPLHKDPESGQDKPESHEPLVIWLPAPSPYGHALTVVG